VIAVDPISGLKRVRQRQRLRAALKHLRAGGMLVISGW